MTFRMNTMFGTVLREVLTGLLITKPNMKRSGIRRRCPGTKKVPRRSRFTLGFHAQTIWEKERGRLTEKHHHNRYQKKKKKKKRNWNGTYTWNVHEHVPSKKKASWVQPNPIPTAHKISTYKHTTKCMKYCKSANGMQCMIILHQKHNSQPKNFTKYSSIFKNP